MESKVHGCICERVQIIHLIMPVQHTQALFMALSFVRDVKHATCPVQPAICCCLPGDKEEVGFRRRETERETEREKGRDRGRDRDLKTAVTNRNCESHRQWAKNSRQQD